MTVQFDESKFEGMELNDLLDYIQTEEYAQLDELSKKTLSSYINKSVSDIKAVNKPAFSGNKAAQAIKNKRMDGIEKADKKLNKEDLELESGLIKDIMAENLAESKETFYSLLATKLAAKIDEAKILLAKGLFNEKKEEAEPEVSDDDYHKSLHGQLKKAEDIDKNPVTKDEQGDPEDKRSKSAGTADPEGHRNIKLKSGEYKLKDGEASHINHFLDGLKPERRSQVLNHMHTSPDHFSSIHKVVKQFTPSK